MSVYYFPELLLQIPINVKFLIHILPYVVSFIIIGILNLCWLNVLFLRQFNGFYFQDSSAYSEDISWLKGVRFACSVKPKWAAIRLYP